MFRFVVVTVIASVLAVSGAIGLTHDPRADKVTPVAGQDAAVLSTGDVAAYVSSLQDRLRRLPRDDASWAALGLGYVEQARVTGNPTFYTQAERAIARSLDLHGTDNAAALGASAALSAARHQFGASLRSATDALRIAPFEPGALAVRVDALTELGRYREQLRALRTADRRQPGVPVAARYAYALELRGELARSSRVLERAAAAAVPADRVYLVTLLADLERRRGLLDRSEGHLGEAQRIAPAYLPALVARARLAVAHGDLDVAVRDWEQVVETLPLPEYLTELGELYEFLGRGAEARRQYDVVDTTTRLFARSGVNTDLEVALFNADHGDPTAALASARAEWRRRKSIHVADALAWSLHRAGNDSRALVLARAATRLGTAESRLWLHRGAIEAQLGLEAEARRHLRRGLSTDPGTSPWQVARARAVLHDLEVLR
jgi:tetratricopeptide (TPR) repeat protein